MNPTEVRQQISALLGEARAIATAAEKSSRDLTVTERASVNQALEQARTLKSRLDAWVGDEELRKALEGFDGLIGPRSGQGPVFGGTKSADTRWSTAGRKTIDGLRGGVKALTGNGTIAVPVAFNTEVIRDGERPTLIRQLLPTETLAGTDRFAFMRQTVRDSNATAIARGTLKPTSQYTTERVEDRVRVIAHLSEPIDRVDLSDSSDLAGFLDQEMRLGVLDAGEDQIINGNGTGENLTGLLNTAGTLAQPYAVDKLTTLRKAITGQQVMRNTPTAWVISPLDWEAIELTRDEGTTGAYTLDAGPVDRAQQRLWGLPVVVTDAIPDGTALLGDFAGGAKVYQREDTVVTWSENLYRPDANGGQGANTFALNQLVMRAEERIGLAVLRPKAFTEVDLTPGA